MEAEQRLLDVRLAARKGVADRLDEQVRQLDARIVGLEEQSEALRSQRSTLADEVSALATLYRQNLVGAGRLNALKRELARVEGEVGRIAAEIAQVRATIAERRLQQAQETDDFLAASMEQLAETERMVAELFERRIAGVDALARLEVRAPRNGIVHESSVHTVGGVVAPGETLMTIVPSNAHLMVEARVSPFDVEQLKVRQGAVVRMPGLDTRQPPELPAVLRSVSPDMISDADAGISYYRASLELDAAAFEKLSQSYPVRPGMPIEAFFTTEDRSVLDYVLKPYNELVVRALREP